MGRPSYRDRLIVSGMRTVHERGFNASGLREITAGAGVAQGSFTNHFASKEEFGVAVLDHYFEQIRGVIALTLGNTKRAPLRRLRDYFEAITALFEVAGWRFGCLAGNMALEASEHSDLIRTRLVEIFREWTPAFAGVIREGQATGVIPMKINADETGAALLEAWHGAMLRMKIDRDPAPLERFKRLVFPALLR